MLEQGLFTNKRLRLIKPNEALPILIGNLNSPPNRGNTCARLLGVSWSLEVLENAMAGSLPNMSKEP